jgi:lysophospholipase L1-like esterase
MPKPKNLFMKRIALCICALLILQTGFAQLTSKTALKTANTSPEIAKTSQWNGKRVAYLGDSMTQPSKNGTNKIYWEYLSEWLGITPFVYGISGHQWTNIYNQAVKLFEEKGTAVDAIFIFAGTNDYNHGIPMGSFFSEPTKETNHNGKPVTRKYRVPVENDTTFCGRVNKAMAFLKSKFPNQQIIILTPIHRGFAKFSDTNVQPEENFANGAGLFLDNYVDALKQAGSIWAVPVIDLYSLSGLYPLADSQVPYFNNADTDRLHPNAKGNYRLAKTIFYQLQALPSTFVAE